MTAEVGTALADYLAARPARHTAREVFVLRRLRPGAPISDEHRRTGGGQRARAGWDRGADAWREPAAPLAGHRAAGRGVGLVEIAGLLGHSLAGHDPDLRRGRRRRAARGGAAVAGGDVMTGSVAVLVEDYIAYAPWAGLPLA